MRKSQFISKHFLSQTNKQQPKPFTNCVLFLISIKIKTFKRTQSIRYKYFLNNSFDDCLGKNKKRLKSDTSGEDKG